MPADSRAPRSIRYAASPAGRLRWQAPQLPDTDRDVVPATSFGPVCPQTMPSVPGAAFVPGADEDCLFLNVYAPPPVLNSNGTGTKLLPVLVWIHGGGYGMGNGRQDMSAIVTDNNRTFLAVSIQYRVCTPSPPPLPPLTPDVTHVVYVPAPTAMR